MDNSVLISRLDGLRNSLAIVIENLGSAVWQPGAGLNARAELLGESSMWNGLGDLVRLLERQRDSVDTLKKQVMNAANDDETLKTAWKSYTSNQRVSQSLLRECLEIIGTLAIRNKDLDRRILYVADELIRDCLLLSRGDESYYLLVHGVEDAVSKTRARIIRLRFPEWTLWDLPLAAHELGHVVIAQTLDTESREDEEDGLRPLTLFRDQLRAWIVQADAEIRGRSAQGGDPAKEADVWAESRVRVLIADAFATFAMGPAYACSAIMLRLNPSLAARQDRPSDVERACVVLSMLSWMNDLVRASSPYAGVLRILEKGWESAVSLAGAPVVLDDPGKKRLKELADEFGQSVSKGFLLGTARYPAEGWRLAQQWSNAWRDQRGKDLELTTPEPEGKLRDVLNATWLSRLEGSPEDYTDFARAGHELCKQIIEARRLRAMGVPGNARIPGR